VVDDAKLVIPFSGEIVALTQPDQCVRALHEIRELEDKLKVAKSELTWYLTQEFRKQGTKTMEFAGLKAELRGGQGVSWDMEVLEELRALGLPEERFNELVQVEISYKVNANVAKSIAAANPEYALIIERAKRTFDTTQYVTIKQP
jgi:hypothetical protein